MSSMHSTVIGNAAEQGICFYLFININTTLKYKYDTEK